MRGNDMGPYDKIIREINARMETFCSMDIVNGHSNIDVHMVARSCMFRSIRWHVWFLDP
jgi:hypothetical protein